MATDAGLRLWRCLCGPLLSFLLSSRSPFTFVQLCREKQRKSEIFRGQPMCKTEYPGTMGLRAIIGFATANRPRIMPPRALAYSLQDLFRYAHNRIGMPLEGTIAPLLLQLRGKSRRNFIIDIRLLNMSSSLYFLRQVKKKEKKIIIKRSL